MLDRKLLRDLRGHKGLLLAVASIVMVGVACYVEMRSCHANLTDARRIYYARCRMADFSIELKKMPAADLGLLRQLPEVLEVRPRIRFYAAVDLEGEPEVLNSQVLSLPDRRSPVINDIVLLRGGYFTEQRANEAILNDAFARRHGLHPGQTIHLILNNRRQELFVVGTAFSSEFVYLVSPGSITPDSRHFGVVYLKQSFAEEVFDFQGAANQVLGRLSPDVRDRPDDLLRRAEALLAPYGVFATTPLKNQPSNRYLSEEIEGLATFTRIMPTIFLAVAALVLNLLLTRLTEQQRVTVGTLKALGYGDVAVFGHFLKFGLTVGLGGGLAGCGLGYLLAHVVTGIYRQFYEFPELANRLHPAISLNALAISVGCAVMGTVFGARSVLRLTPAAAMRPKPPEKGGAVWLEHARWFWRRLSFGWRLVLRNLFRNRFRTAAGMFAAAMGASILVCGFMMHTAMLHLVEFQFQKIQRADYDLAFQDERGAEAVLEARRFPGVDRAEPVLDVACTFQHGPYAKRGGITGIAPHARLTVPRDEQGRAIRIPPSGLVMSGKLARILHVERGGRVAIQPIKGAREVVQAPVAEIANSYLGLAVYADIGYLNRLIREEAAVTGVQLAADGRPDHRRDFFRELKRLPAIQAVNARSDSIANLVNTVIRTQTIFIGLLIFFAGVIFFGSILNGSLIGLAEREREVATLRVLGYDEWEIGGLFLRESMVVNLLGTLAGLPLGYRLTRLLADSYDTELFRIPVVTTPWVWFATLGLAVLFGLAAHALVQRVIWKLNWLDALKVKE